MMRQMIIAMEIFSQAVTIGSVGTRIQMLVPVCSHEEVQKMLSWLEYWAQKLNRIVPTDLWRLLYFIFMSYMSYIKTSQEDRQEILWTQDHCVKISLMQIFYHAPTVQFLDSFLGLLHPSFPKLHSDAECRLPMSSGKEVRAAADKVLLHFGSALRTHRVDAQSTHQEIIQPPREPRVLLAGSCATWILAKPKPRSAGAIMRFLDGKRKCLCFAIRSWKHLGAERKFQCLSLIQREKIQQLNLSNPNE